MNNEISDLVNEFKQFNGFYKKKNSRELIYKLFKGKCAFTQEHIDISDMDIGHVIPQSDGEYFSDLFPGLDVHNIINLQPLSSSHNRRVGNHYVKNPFILKHAFDYNISVVRRRIASLNKDLNSKISQSVVNYDNILNNLYKNYTIPSKVLLDASASFGNICFVSFDVVKNFLLDNKINVLHYNALESLNLYSKGLVSVKDNFVVSHSLINAECFMILFEEDLNQDLGRTYKFKENVPDGIYFLFQEKDLNSKEIVFSYSGSNYLKIQCVKLLSELRNVVPIKMNDRSMNGYHFFYESNLFQRLSDLLNQHKENELLFKNVEFLEESYFSKCGEFEEGCGVTTLTNSILKNNFSYDFVVVDKKKFSKTLNKMDNIVKLMQI